MAPHSPQRSGRPGQAAAALEFHARAMGGPAMAPHSPQRSGRPGQAVAALEFSRAATRIPRMQQPQSTVFRVIG